MGYAFMIGNCLCCKRRFTFNPMKVPSYNWKGNKEPVCEGCMRVINKERERKGLKPHPIHPDAYEVCREEEII